MGEPRVGVVGVGHLGRHHARLYKTLGVLAAVADTNADRAKEVAGEYGVPAFTDHRELFGRVDAVSVAVPTADHFEIAREFLGRGVHALVEKPLAKTIEQGEEMVRLARANGAILAVGHVERFNPAVQAALRVLEKPRFIEVHRLSPFRYRSSDIDVVMDLMIHDLDIVLHLVRSPLRQVSAVGVALLFGREDIANARLEFEDGCVANLTASRISVQTMRKIRVFTEQCYVNIDTLAKEAWIYRATPQLASALEKLPRDRDLTFADLALIPKEFYSVERVKMPDEEPLANELESFVECVRAGREPEVPGEHGVRAMRAAERILEGMRAHRWT
ncbi:MAG: Gfo/Idh/MocA family oxidoreductase [Planctomycetes bacterium]|nr:Gfo/Idh/MocA family oxidoreductase [Planctomycetota bacterium]